MVDAVQALLQTLESSPSLCETIPEKVLNGMRTLHELLGNSQGEDPRA